MAALAKIMKKIKLSFNNYNNCATKNKNKWRSIVIVHLPDSRKPRGGKSLWKMVSEHVLSLSALSASGPGR